MKTEMIDLIDILEFNKEVNAIINSNSQNKSNLFNYEELTVLRGGNGASDNKQGNDSDN